MQAPQLVLDIVPAASARIPNVENEPAPDVETVDFIQRGPVPAVRPHTHTDHYPQVYFDTNKAIADAFGGARYPVLEEHLPYAAREPW
jgi:small conductance mechanosensitive channel